MALDVFSSFDISLFSSFTPLSIFYLFSLSFPFLFFLTFLYKPFMSFSTLFPIIFSPFTLDQLFSPRSGNSKWSGSILLTLFLFILLTNFFGILPYSFSLSSHLILTLALGIPLFLMISMSSLYFSSTSFLTYYVPSGAPLVLAPFLVLIEMVSYSVRPLTLSFRLAANMTAGHLILGLISTALVSLLFKFFSVGILALSLSIFYSAFELVISFLQAFIFFMLLKLYLSEHS